MNPVVILAFQYTSIYCYMYILLISYTSHARYLPPHVDGICLIGCGCGCGCRCVCVCVTSPLMLTGYVLFRSHQYDVYDQHTHIHIHIHIHICATSY